MRTAAISYRVADFLKGHPPFQSMDETDLLSLVARGRVRFHEVDEFLCWQDTGYTPFLLVIQRGTVSLWEQAGGKERLRDICGPGDLIGVERLLGSETYPYSAKANEDVIVYALHAEDFERLVGKYSHAERYVRAYANTGALSAHSTRETPNTKFVGELAQHPEPLTCEPGCSIAEAASMMANSNAYAIAVMEENSIRGVLNARDIVRLVGSGEVLSRPVREVMTAPPPSVAPQTTVAECALKMARTTSRLSAMTADGTPNGGLLRLISAADLQPAFGDNPVSLLDEIEHARDVERLRSLRQRARELTSQELTNASTVEWLAGFCDCVHTAFVRRLSELAGTAEAKWTWCFAGPAGRGESLTTVEPAIALICQSEADVDRGCAALTRLRADMAACGYASRGTQDMHPDRMCGTLGTWKERFARWVENPVASGWFAARDVFDLRAIMGDASGWQELHEYVREAVASNASFQKLMANDCLSSLPPLTFFQDEVIDECGQGGQVLRLQSSALGPAVDVGRVFAILSGSVFGLSTLQRLELARKRMPERDSIFRNASDTVRVLLYLQGRTASRLQSDGTEILASQLSRLDRHVLKQGFHAIRALLDFTVQHVWELAD